MNKTRRSLRLPNHIIQTLRDLRDSHIGSSRPIPELVRCCMKQTQGVDYLNITGTTREESEKIDVWLPEEYSTLDHSELVGRVCHALIGVQAKLDYYQLGINRGTVPLT